MGQVLGGGPADEPAGHGVLGDPEVVAAGHAGQDRVDVGSHENLGLEEDPGQLRQHDCPGNVDEQGMGVLPGACEEEQDESCDCGVQKHARGERQ